MRWALLVVILLPSCTFLRSVQSATESLDRGLVKVDTALGAVNKGLAKYEAAKVEADKDGDGKTTSAEWLAYLLGGGGTVGAGLLGLLGRRNARSDARKDVIESRLAALESGKAA